MLQQIGIGATSKKKFWLTSLCCPNSPFAAAGYLIHV